MKTKLDHIVRELEESDKKFIIDSFMRSYVTYEYKLAHDKLSDKSRFFRMLPRRFSFDGYRFMITGILESDLCQVLVAGDPCQQSIIYGYVIFSPENNIIVFTYVKDLCRRQGVGTSLIEYATDLISKKNVGLVYTTKVGKKFFNSLHDKIDKEFKQIDVVMDYA